MIVAMSTDQLVAATSPRTDDVRAVTQEVWATFLGRTEPLVTDVERPLVPSWSASVTIKGEWNGMVALETTELGAQRLTRAMLGLEPDTDDVNDADLVDAVGELVNMVGGNVKGLVPGPSRLSLPLVAAGRFAHGSGQVEVVRLPCLWGGEPVLVTVHTGRAAVRRVPR